MDKNSRNVPFCVPWIGEEEIQEVLDTLKSGWLTTGPKARLFEKKLQKYNGVKHAFAVNSCTAALHLALAALDIGPGDEVITSPLTFCSTVNAILYVGAKPVLADIDEKTYNISPEEIEKKVSEKTKAVIPVHFGGQPCDMKAINGIAKKQGLKVVEDAAHAIGAEFNGKKAGSLADLGCYSFYPTKNITTGEGGAVVTDDDAIADKLPALSYCGLSKDAWKRYDKRGSWYYEVTELGFKYNLSDVLASIGLAQLDRLDGFIKAREKIAKKYDKAFSGSGALKTPFVEKNIKHAWHLYPLLLEKDKLKIDRAEFIKKLSKAGIGTSVHFIPIPLHPYYKGLGLCMDGLPATASVFENEISLPIYPKMIDEDVECVISSVLSIVEKNRR